MSTHSPSGTSRGTRRGFLGGVGAAGRAARRADAAAAPRAQAARAADPTAARADLPRDAGRRHVGRAFRQLFDDPLADSSWADRRARLPWEIFAELMRRVLAARARRGGIATRSGGAGGWSPSTARNSV